MRRNLNELKRKRIEREIITDESPAVLSHGTVWKIEHGIPVSYRSAVLYCKELGLDPHQTIIIERKIPILEEIA